MTRKQGHVRPVAVALAALAIAWFQVQTVKAEPAAQQSPHHNQRQVAIVIDDFGNGMTGTQDMMQLPVKITTAVMPFMPTTKSDAELAHKLGHDVIVHMPMEPVRGKPEWLGPGAVLTSMSDAEIRKRVEAAINDVPYAIGMNNHMGSKVTADERVMRVVLTVVKERGLFFLDSRTTFKTVLPKVAAELGVPLLSNHVFLDDVYSSGHIAKQVGLLRKCIESKGSCITIGHVGPPGKMTSAALREAIPRFQRDTRFVRLSEMLPSSTPPSPSSPSTPAPSSEKQVVPHS